MITKQTVTLVLDIEVSEHVRYICHAITKEFRKNYPGRTVYLSNWINNALKEVFLNPALKNKVSIDTLSEKIAQVEAGVEKYYKGYRTRGKKYGKKSPCPTNTI